MVGQPDHDDRPRDEPHRGTSDGAESGGARPECTGAQHRHGPEHDPEAVRDVGDLDHPDREARPTAPRRALRNQTERNDRCDTRRWARACGAGLVRPCRGGGRSPPRHRPPPARHRPPSRWRYRARGRGSLDRAHPRCSRLRASRAREARSRGERPLRLRSTRPRRLRGRRPSVDRASASSPALLRSAPDRGPGGPRRRRATPPSGAASPPPARSPPGPGAAPSTTVVPDHGGGCRRPTRGGPRAWRAPPHLTPPPSGVGRAGELPAEPGSLTVTSPTPPGRPAPRESDVDQTGHGREAAASRRRRLSCQGGGHTSMHAVMQKTAAIVQPRARPDGRRRLRHRDGQDEGQERRRVAVAAWGATIPAKSTRSRPLHGHDGRHLVGRDDGAQHDEAGAGDVEPPVGHEPVRGRPVNSTRRRSAKEPNAPNRADLRVRERRNG